MYKKDLIFKIKVVKEYLSGKNGSIHTIAKKYNLSLSTIRNWIEWYKAEGIDGLKKQTKNKNYTGEFKLSVIQYRKINNTSYRETANYFNIKNASIIAAWEKKYREGGLKALSSKKGRPSKNMKKQHNNNLDKPLNETEREELIRLRSENEYLKLKEIYAKKVNEFFLKKNQETKKKHK